MAFGERKGAVARRRSSLPEGPKLTAITPKFLNETIGALLRAEREKLGINQTEIARVLGIEQSALSRVEKGAQQLTAAQLLVFVDHLNIPLLRFDLARRTALWRRKNERQPIA